MDAKLHQPLGLDRPPPRRKRILPSLSTAMLTIGAAGLVGLSFYSALVPLPLSYEATPAAPVLADTPPTAEAQPQQAANNGAIRARGGANVETTTLADGSVVTKFTPRQRDGSGPMMLDAQRIGQDSRVADVPNPDLVEQSPYGPLPKIGADGLRPVEQYARPWSGARGARVAIIVGGLGLSQTGTQRALKHLPEGVTLAFAATGNSLQRWSRQARQDGHEILLQVPFEPFDYPANDPGRGTLLVSATARDNLAKLHEAMGRVTNYTGIMNYMGGRFLSDAAAVEPVLRDVAARGLLFLDDGSSARSLTGTLAKALGLPQAGADLLLDGQLQQDAILKKLDELERLARRNGSAIGVASAFDESIAAIGKWADEAAGRGIEIVGVSALAADVQP